MQGVLVIITSRIILLKFALNVEWGCMFYVKESKENVKDANIFAELSKKKEIPTIVLFVKEIKKKDYWYSQWKTVIKFSMPIHFACSQVTHGILIKTLDINKAKKYHRRLNNAPFVKNKVNFAKVVSAAIKNPTLYVLFLKDTTCLLKRNRFTLIVVKISKYKVGYLFKESLG